MATNEINLNEVCLLKVFSYISTRKLSRLAIVCKTWNELIKEEMKNRQDFFIELYVGRDKWFNYNDEKMCIKKEDFIDEYERFLSKYQFDSFKKPSIMINFLTPDFGYGEQSIITNNLMSDPSNILASNTMPAIRLRKIFSSNIQLISSLFPRSVNSLYVIGDSILANNLNEYTGNTTQKSWASKLGATYVPVKPAIASLFLENSDSYRFGTKQLINQGYELANIKTEADLKRFFGANNDETVRFVLILVGSIYQRDNRVLKDLVKNLTKIRKSTNDRLVVAGYFINEVVSDKELTDFTRIESEITFVTLISKSDKLDDVEVAQMMIPGPNDQEDTDYMYHPDNPDYPENYHLKEKLKQLKLTACGENITQKKIFTIVSRSLRRENEMTDDNLAVFRKEFPQVPIIGIKGKSKIGHDNYPNVPKAVPDRQNQLNYDVKLYDFNYMDSSIYTVISLKD